MLLSSPQIRNRSYPLCILQDPIARKKIRKKIFPHFVEESASSSDAFPISTKESWHAPIYNPLLGKTRFNAEEVFDLETEIERFFASEQPVLLLQRDSGSGKSLFCTYLADKIHAKDFFACFISLPNLRDPKTMIEELLAQYGIDQKEQLQETLRINKQRILLICDAYDEILGRKNLYQINRLDEWALKMIITCRSEYLHPLGYYTDHFIPYQEGRPRRALLREILVAPFNPQQIELYLKKYVEESTSSEKIPEGHIWYDWTICKQALDVIPSLSALIQPPFLLQIAVEALPSIWEKLQKENA